MRRLSLLLAIVVTIAGDSSAQPPRSPAPPYDPTAVILEQVAEMDIGPLDWPMFGGSSLRNNTPYGAIIPTHWDIETGENILWSAALGSQTYCGPTVANGKAYIGTNNASGYVTRYPKDIDLGCLICFDAETGEFLWQHSNKKLPTGRVHDWPDQGVGSIPLCDGDRLWYVSNRGCVCCLDAEGFHDGENDGPYLSEESELLEDADIVWEYDMMAELGISQHNLCCWHGTAWGDTLFINTCNGVDESHINIPAPNAPSFIAMNKHTAEVLWTDKSPGINILHGQWCSPAIAELGGVPQVIFGGGDGWFYSFTIEGDGKGNAELLWKFDGNPKETRFILGGRGTRNETIAPPVVYDGLVYLVMDQDPEHGEGNGHVWCIDPTKRGDVSSELAIDADGNEIPHRRIQAVIAADGERAIPNPNSAVVWHYTSSDLNGDGTIAWEEEMHRSLSPPAIKDDLMVVPDFSGLVHCFDAKTGEHYWGYDAFSASWGSAMIVEGKVYVADEEGDVAIFELSREMNLLAEVYLENSVYSTPIVANNVLYVMNKDTLFAIAENE